MGTLRVLAAWKRFATFLGVLGFEMHLHSWLIPDQQQRLLPLCQHPPSSPCFQMLENDAIDPDLELPPCPSLKGLLLPCTRVLIPWSVCGGGEWRHRIPSLPCSPLSLTSIPSMHFSFLFLGGRGHQGGSPLPCGVERGPDGWSVRFPRKENEAVGVLN